MFHSGILSFLSVLFYFDYYHFSKITYGVDMFSVMFFLYSSKYHLSEPNGWMFPLYEILLGYQYTHNLEPLPLWLTGSPLGKLFHSGILSFLSVFFVFTLITTILVERTYGMDCSKY
jgi:hypothetical protein